MPPSCPPPTILAFKAVTAAPSLAVSTDTARVNFGWANSAFHKPAGVGSRRPRAASAAEGSTVRPDVAGSSANAWPATVSVIGAAARGPIAAATFAVAAAGDIRPTDTSSGAAPLTVLLGSTPEPTIA